MRLFICALLLLASAEGESRIRGRVTDARTGEVIPCTVVIRTADGRVVTGYPGFNGGFRSTGTFDKPVPAGQAEVTIRRGFDYVAASRTVQLRDGQSIHLDFALQRRTP